MKRLWYRIQFWIEHHLSPRHLKVVKTAYDSPAYDWAYLLKLERSKLKEMKTYFETKFVRETFDHENDIKWIGICIKLIDIIIESSVYDTPEEVNKYVNTRNMKRFYHLKKGVTWDKVENHVKHWPNDLRILKAENLYYEIRKYYTRYWWD